MQLHRHESNALTVSKAQYSSSYIKTAVHVTHASTAKVYTGNQHNGSKIYSTTQHPTPTTIWQLKHQLTQT